MWPVDNENKNMFISPEVENLIEDTLPSEILDEIFSMLNKEDIRQTSLMSHFWSQKSVEILKSQNVLMIKNFMKFLAENLPKNLYEKREENLPKISEIKGLILNSKNLKECVLKINIFKIEISNSLKDLEMEDLNRLEELSKNEFKPKFFEDVFQLARVYKNLDSINLILNENDKNKIIKDNVKLLAQLAGIDKALEVYTTLEVCNIIEEDRKNFVLIEIAEVAAEKGLFDKSIEIAQKTSTMKALSFKIIAKIAAEKDLFDEAVEIANMASNINKPSILLEIAKIAAEKTLFDKAIEI